MTILAHKEPAIMGVISNSETTVFQTCERRHFYNFGLRLQPKKLGAGLTRGILGHEVLAVFYAAIKAGESYDDAVAAAMAAIDAIILEDLNDNSGLNMELLTPLRQRLSEYFVVARDDCELFIPVEVETELRVELPNGMDYAMRLDLLVEMRKGPFKGELVLYDHKFVWDFYSEDEVRMNAQLPKYLGILRANGYHARRAYLNQIRTRVNKSPMAAGDKFRRSLVNPTQRRIKNIFEEELKVAGNIEFFRSLSLEQWEDEITRSMSPQNCKTCAFSRLCSADLDGEDTTLMKEYDYTATTYGYSDKDSSNG